MSRISAALCLSAMLVVPGAALADGRTDGPEGSEVGKGGYDKPLSGSFSLALDWGASISTASPLSGASRVPIYLGGTASFWLTDWFLLDGHGAYAFDTGRLFVLVGPRFRTWSWPVSFGAGLRAGLINDPAPGTGPRFGLSPVVSADMIFRRHLLAGLQAMADIPIAGNGVTFRIGINIGWRF